MRFALIVLFSFIVSGCASTPAYNPMQMTSQQELLLNESGFKALANGMTQDQVHKIMGQSLVIGYGEENANYKPLTIANPYKTEAIKGTDYVIEYYIESIRQPDGTVHDNELMPLIFKGGKLGARGWDQLNAIRPAKPSA